MRLCELGNSPNSTNQLATQTGGINPATGRAYVPSDFPDEPVAQPAAVASAMAQPASVTRPAAKSQRIGAPAGKAAIDTAVKTVNAVRSDRRQAVIDYGQEELDAAERRLSQLRRRAPAAATEPVAQTQPVKSTAVPPPAPAATGTFAPTTPAPAWAKGQPIKIGKQTITSRDPNYAKILKGLGVTEGLIWSEGFDPSLRLLSNIKGQP